jgi:hypothetical protein
MNPQLPQFISKDTTGHCAQEHITISTLSLQSNLTTPEQIRRFELLRLAFFTLKLRKLEQRIEGSEHRQKENSTTRETNEHQLHCSLLRHVIFQQIVTLTKLDAREQALQLIDACRK